LSLNKKSKAMRKLLIAIILIVQWVNVTSQSITQTVKGKVVDKETQIAMAGAFISIYIAGQIISTSCDESGNFRLSAVPLGRHSLKVAFIGYEDVVVGDMLVSSGKEVVLNIEMKEKVTNMKEIIVRANAKDKSINSMTTLSSRMFSVEETRRYAGGFDDPARLASAFAGVATNSNVENNGIMVRGNAPTGVLWKVEGSEVANPNHFAGAHLLGGGFVTFFSNNMLSNSDFLTGAFPAEYGNGLSAVFDIKIRSGNNERYEHSFGAGVMGIDFASEGPLKKGKPASYVFNYRYSTFGLLRSFMPEGEGLPVYQDLCLKFNFPTANVGTFSFWGVGALDDFSRRAETDSTDWNMVQKRQDNDAKFNTVISGITHKITIGKRSYLNTSVCGSLVNVKAEMKFLEDNLQLNERNRRNNNEGRLTVSTYLNTKIRPNHVNRTGIIFNSLFYDFNNSSFQKTSNKLELVASGKGMAQRFQVYSQSKFDIGNFSFNAGLHVHYFSLNNEISLEPRAGIRWNLNQNQALSFAYGNHSQTQDLNIYFISKKNNDGTISDNKNLKFSRANHFVLGYDLRLSENLRLKVEPYYQYLYNLPVVKDSSFSLINLESDANLDELLLVNKGTGRNIGVDITFERFLDKGFYYLITASVFDSKFKGGDGVERNTKFNRNFVGNVLGGKEWTVGKNNNNIFGLNGRLYLIGGDRVSPIDYIASIADKDVVYDQNRLYEDRGPFTYRLDLSVTYRHNHPRYSTIWAIEVLNLSSSVITYQNNYNYVTHQVQETKGKGMFPTLSYKIEF
jgi:hypothetical protein